MDPLPPELVAIDPHDYAGPNVGRTKDGRQFFLTTPFLPTTGHASGREFIARYLFDPGGTLLEVCIDDLGPRAELDKQEAHRCCDRRLAELGPVIFGAIWVRPVRLDRFGTTFALVPTPWPGKPGAWWMKVEPGDFLAYFPSWRHPTAP